MKPLILSSLILASLALPILAEDEGVHIVRKGESYEEIAREHGVDEGSLRTTNEGLELRAGHILRIPPRAQAVNVEPPHEAAAGAAIPPRVEKGGFYQLWYDAPRSFYAGLTERHAFVRVKAVEGEWVFADVIYSESAAVALLIIAELEKGNPDLDKRLAEGGKSKEEFLKKAAEDPPGEFLTRSLWINLAKVEAIQRMDVNAELEKAKAKKAAGEKKN